MTNKEKHLIIQALAGSYLHSTATPMHSHRLNHIRFADGDIVEIHPPNGWDPEYILELPVPDEEEQQIIEDMKQLPDYLRSQYDRLHQDGEEQ